MSGKVYTTENKRIKYQFIVPSFFSEQVVKDGVKAVRTGYGSSWERPFLKNEFSVTDFEMTCLEDKSKFIIVHDEEDENSQKHMFIFSKDIDHDRMFEVIQNIVYDNAPSEDGNRFKGPLPLNVYSAGFVNNAGMCYGHSATLEVKSKARDSEIFTQCFKKES